MTKEEFDAVQERVESVAEGMLDDGIYDNMDTAMEMAWEFVRDEIQNSTDPAEYYIDFDLPASLNEIDQKAVGVGAQFGETEYEKYVEWCKERYGA